MKKITLALLAFQILSWSCTKSHTCQCYNPGGKAEAYIYKGTLKSAEKQCEEINAKNQTPWSETYCKLE